MPRRDAFEAVADEETQQAHRTSDNRVRLRHWWSLDDRAMVRRMVTALSLRADLAETHLVPVAQLVEEAELGAENAWPLRLAHLRAFLATRRARLAAALGHPIVAANTRSHGATRIAAPRAMSAAQVIIDDEEAELASVAAESWQGEVDPFASVADVLAAASMVDVPSRREHGMPLDPRVDIAPVVLLALHCCIDANSSSVHTPWLDQVSWLPIPMDADSNDPIPDDTVRVRPSIYADGIHELYVADVRALVAARAIAPGSALLRMSVVASYLDE